MTRGDLTPTLESVIIESIRSELSDLHTCMPGIVKSVDHAKKTVNVRLCLKRKYIDEDSAIELPELAGVPLGFLQTKKAIISLPVAVGDDVWVFFSERALEYWKSTKDTDQIANRIVVPGDTRQHHLSDAVAVPMFKPIASGQPSDPNNILIQNDKGKLTIAPDGKYYIGNGTEELLSLFSETLQAILDAVTNTGIGPQPFVNLATFSAIKSRLDSQLKQ